MYRNILIVDDSKVSRMIIKKIILEVVPDIEISEAACGDEALDQMADNTFEAAIVDFHMPGIDGLALAGKLKELQPSLAITMMTANIQHEIEERATALGVGYLTKPPRKDDIAAFLES